MGNAVYSRMRGKRAKVKVRSKGAGCSAMNGEPVGSEGGEERGPCGDVVSVQGARDVASGSVHASEYATNTGQAGEEWGLGGRVGTNGREDDFSSEEDEEEGGGGRVESGYMLLPQDAEVVNGEDEISEEDEGVATGHTLEEISSPHARESDDKLQALGDSDDKLQALGDSLGGGTSSVSPTRVSRWMERQVRDLTVAESKQQGSSNRGEGRKDRGGGGGGGGESWAKFSEVAPSTGTEDWPSSSGAAAAGPVTPSSTMEKGISLHTTV